MELMKSIYSKMIILSWIFRSQKLNSHRENKFSMSLENHRQDNFKRWCQIFFNNVGLSSIIIWKINLQIWVAKNKTVMQKLMMMRMMTYLNLLEILPHSKNQNKRSQKNHMKAKLKQRMQKFLLLMVTYTLDKDQDGKKNVKK